MPDLNQVLAAIDAANAADPVQEAGRPAALLYGERMTAELARIAPDAPETLQIAARGQHIERWTLPRDTYPEGREGYLRWRRDQSLRHANRVAGIMRAAGYDAADVAAVEMMLRKEAIKRNASAQLLEDVICLVFLRWYFQPFAAGRDAAALLRIVEKTARKMSVEGRARVLADFDLPEPFAAAFR